jgi:nucleotide-binding universal stress UspA family protein
MTMKAILAHVDEHDGLPSVLRCALLAAQRFGSHIEGLFVWRGVPRMVPVAPEGAFLPASDLVEDLERADRERSARLRQIFETFMAKHNVPLAVSGRSEGEPSASWSEQVVTGDDALGTIGRLHDLIVVGRPVDGQPVPMMSALETALFESGRTLLIAPPELPSTLGEMMVIAWNGSTETALTIALAGPFLAQAKEVVVLSVEDGMVAGPSGADVTRYLHRNDIAASAKTIRSGDRPVGGAILEECGALGCDLLVKGAYTHSRLRQMIFGGATSHILGKAQLPVIMAH